MVDKAKKGGGEVGQSPTLVTGGTGFVGRHLARKLVARGEKVRVLARQRNVGAGPRARPDNRGNHGGLPLRDIDICQGDLADLSSLRQALKGCRFLYHVAADYRLWSLHPEELYRSNVEGTRNILQAAKEAGVEKIVYTSTVGTLGNPGDGTPGNEETPVSIKEMSGHYKRSKFLAEKVVLDFIQQGLPIAIVNPSTPVGSWDVKPTPTGQMIVDFLKGKMFGYIETGLNLVDVEDVAEGHIQAMQKGRIGQKYILGNQNLPLLEIFRILSRITGRPAPRRRIPYPIAFSYAALSTLYANGFGKKPPRISLEAVRLSRKYMYFDSSKAMRELTFQPGSVEVALEKAARWFQENHYV